MGQKRHASDGSSMIKKPSLHRVVLFQVVLTFCITCVCYGLFGLLAAKSALLGGLAVAIPNSYAGWRAFRYNRTRSATAVLGSMYAAEIGKLGLTALMFALVFKLVENLAAEIFFIVFVLVLLIGLLITPKLMKHR